ncbi:MAG TPA: hypothetical protein VGE39_05245 [Prosthecobacter sp.]
MHTDNIKRTFESRGFQWTPHLEELTRAHAGDAYDYPHYVGNLTMAAEFYDASTLDGDRSSPRYARTAAYLQEEIAPVGWCEGGVTEMLLTTSGNLIGFNDYLLQSWSSEKSPNWRDSIERMLRGEDPRVMGTVSKRMPD